MHTREIFLLTNFIRKVTAIVIKKKVLLKSKDITGVIWFSLIHNIGDDPIDYFYSLIALRERRLTTVPIRFKKCCLAGVRLALF